MTTPDHNEEWTYALTERLGIICEDREATEQERNQATREAREWMGRLEKHEQQKGNAV